jgi:hypothetical protein
MQSSCPVVGAMDEETWGSDDPLGKEGRSCFKEAADSEDSASPSPDSNSRAGLKATPESRPRGGASQLLRCAAACRRDPRTMPRLTISPGLIRARPRGGVTTMDLGTSPQCMEIANSIAGSVWLSSRIKVSQVPVNQVLGASGLVRRQITIEVWSLAAAQPRSATRVNSFAVDKGFRSRKMSLPTWRSPITRPRRSFVCERAG